jgi:2-oxoglutarate dehydrogenase E2 component (dihydrolipoamide succinyltransferase)
LPDVVLPALGESITEGIVTKWFKAIGENVSRDEPLFEISTDKVDSEVPSPASGVLTAILAEEGDTVAVGATVAVIGDAGTAVLSAAAEAGSPVVEAEAPTAEPAEAPSVPAVAGPPSASGGTGGRSASPMVRRLLEDAHLDEGAVRASGPGGRITRADAEGAVRSAAAAPAGAQAAAPAPIPLVGEQGAVSSGFVAVEADYEAVRRAKRSAAAKAAEAEGVVLDEAVFALRAAVEALAEFPLLNASIGPAGLKRHGVRNIGVAIDFDGRLLVPVITDAQDLNLRGLSRRLAELLGRARSGELAVEDLIGGTFTVATAPSPSVLVAMPQLIEPQVAILSVGGVSRRAVALSDDAGGDAISVRSVGILGLGFDPRVIDATTAAHFLERVANLLADQDWAAEL